MNDWTRPFIRPRKKQEPCQRQRLLKNTAFSPNYNCTIHLRTDGVSERPISTAAGVRTHHCSADHISSESFEHDVPLVPAAFIYCKFQDRKLQACAMRGEERSRRSSDCFHHHASVSLLKGSRLPSWKMIGRDKTRTCKINIFYFYCA